MDGPLIEFNNTEFYFLLLLLLALAGSIHREACRRSHYVLVVRVQVVNALFEFSVVCSQKPWVGLWAVSRVCRVSRMRRVSLGPQDT